MKTYKERHLYFFPCKKCGRKNAVSFKKAKANKGICRNCRKNNINKNQISLFN